MGTSIPKRSNEMKGTPPSPVTTYTLSPEELAKIEGKPIPKSHTKPLGFDVKVKNIREDEKDMPKVNKEEYFALRAQGSSRKEAAKKLGTSKQSLESYWFKQWGIKNDAGEEVESQVQGVASGEQAGGSGCTTGRKGRGEGRNAPCGPIAGTSSGNDD